MCGERMGIEQGDEWVINWLKNKTEHRQHLKKHQITFNPFADYPIDVNLFPADNFCILEELESQQAPLLLYPLFIEKEMREENGYKLDLDNCSERTLKGCDFIRPETPMKTGSCPSALRPLELRWLHKDSFKLKLFP